MTPKKLNRSNFQHKKYTERIVQFGEGNFLRAFADHMIHQMNQQAAFDAGVVVVQPIRHGMAHLLNEQDGLYTVFLNGIKKGEAVSESELVDCIQRAVNPYESFDEFIQIADNPNLRFVLSNTTEAGIAYRSEDKPIDTPPESFPGKLTVLLKRRFDRFSSAANKGLIVIPCELIERNGESLKRIVLRYALEWGYGEEFIKWINNHNVFANTLVDRIVPGYPRSKIKELTDKLGYEDQLIVEGEQFHLWVIEGLGHYRHEIPTTEAGLNVLFTDDLTPYRTRKVRILNGAHTAMVPVAYLYGHEFVRESVEDEVIGKFILETIREEICPTLELPANELSDFTDDVIDRFRNPYLQHALMSISLNSFAKFKTRVLPSLLAYREINQSLPTRLCFSLACLLLFYRGRYNGKEIALHDDQEVLDFAKQLWDSFDQNQDVGLLVRGFLSQEKFWGLDLNEIAGLTELLISDLDMIIKSGVKSAINSRICV